MKTPAAVIKLGGSLALAPALREWLAVIAAARVPVIMVAGGGPFADAVREAQAVIGFDDNAAHRMAILAMAQFAEALASLDARLVLAADEEAVAAALDRQRPVIWNPLPLALDSAIPHRWDVTSDSLAAWLARRLGAAHLILIKQVGRQPPPLTAEALAERGIVDRAFPEMARGVPGLWLADREALPALGAVMKGRQPGETTLTRID
jgi:5-(aminomethyl)-3-furanmethanol phosphate kinase